MNYVPLKITQPLKANKKIANKLVFLKSRNFFQPKNILGKKHTSVYKKEDHSLLTHTCIGATIRISQEFQCLPRAGFFVIIQDLQFPQTVIHIHKHIKRHTYGHHHL